MRLRNITGSREFIAENGFVVHEPEKLKGNWKQGVFDNQKELHIEIGMGKGRFIMELARRNPQINFIGIEKYSSVLLRAIQKIEQEKEVLSNLKFIRMDAETITEVFAKDEIDKIYLNFSDPWPKDRHAKRRLPSREFLGRYSQILKEGADLEFKTDNRSLFDFAMEEAAAAGWKIKQHTYDLHNNPEMVKDNIMTEYEEKFSAIGNPICKYVITQR